MTILTIFEILVGTSNRSWTTLDALSSSISVFFRLCAWGSRGRKFEILAIFDNFDFWDFEISEIWLKFSIVTLAVRSYLVKGRLEVRRSNFQDFGHFGPFWHFDWWFVTFLIKFSFWSFWSFWSILGREGPGGTLDDGGGPGKGSSEPGRVWEGQDRGRERAQGRIWHFGPSGSKFEVQGQKFEVQGKFLVPGQKFGAGVSFGHFGHFRTFWDPVQGRSEKILGSSGDLKKMAYAWDFDQDLDRRVILGSKIWLRFHRLRVNFWPFWAVFGNFGHLVILGQGVREGLVRWRKTLQRAAWLSLGVRDRGQDQVRGWLRGQGFSESGIWSRVKIGEGQGGPRSDFWSQGQNLRVEGGQILGRFGSFWDLVPESEKISAISLRGPLKRWLYARDFGQDLDRRVILGSFDWGFKIWGQFGHLGGFWAILAILVDFGSMRGPGGVWRNGGGTQQRAAEGGVKFLRRGQVRIRERGQILVIFGQFWDILDPKNPKNLDLNGLRDLSKRWLYARDFWSGFGQEGPFRDQKFDLRFHRLRVNFSILDDFGTILIFVDFGSIRVQEGFGRWRRDPAKGSWGPGWVWGRGQGPRSNLRRLGQILAILGPQGWNLRVRGQNLRVRGQILGSFWSQGQNLGSGGSKSGQGQGSWILAIWGHLGPFGALGSDPDHLRSDRNFLKRVEGAVHLGPTKIFEDHFDHFGQKFWGQILVPRGSKFCQGRNDWGPKFSKSDFWSQGSNLSWDLDFGHFGSIFGDFGTLPRIRKIFRSVSGDPSQKMAPSQGILTRIWTGGFYFGVQNLTEVSSLEGQFWPFWAILGFLDILVDLGRSGVRGFLDRWRIGPGREQLQRPGRGLGRVRDRGLEGLGGRFWLFWPSGVRNLVRRVRNFGPRVGQGSNQIFGPRGRFWGPRGQILAIFHLSFWGPCPWSDPDPWGRSRFP